MSKLKEKERVISLRKGCAGNPELEDEYSTGAFARLLSEQNKNLGKLLRQVTISIAKAMQALQEQTPGVVLPESNLSPGELQNFEP